MGTRPARLPALLGLLAACQASVPEARFTAREAVDATPVASVARPRLIRLRHSLAALARDFNAHRGKPRLILVISPACSQGVAALRDGLLEGLAQGDFHVLVIWSDPFRRDCEREVLEILEGLADPRLTFFLDDRHRAGRALARGFLPVGVARDVYLFYGPETVWKGDPPRPTDWTHQLGRLLPERFASIDELGGRLRRSMSALLGGQPVTPPMAR